MALTAVIGFSEPFLTTHRFYVGTPVSVTATGSGTGTGSADGRIALLRRTATGSGVGTMDSTGLVVSRRQATGSGTGTESASGYKIVYRHVDSSAGTGSSAVFQILTNKRTASGSGTGSQTTVFEIIYNRTATGSGSGSGSADGARFVFATCSGSGQGTSSTVWTKSHIFRIPTTTGFAWAEMFGDRLSDRIFAHIPQGVRVENLWRLSDGSYTINNPGYGVATREYLGGHNIFLTDEEVSELTAAGYGAYIT